MFGDLDMLERRVDEFEGIRTGRKGGRRKRSTRVATTENGVESYNVPLEILKRGGRKEEVDRLESGRAVVERVMKELVERVQVSDEVLERVKVSEEVIQRVQVSEEMIQGLATEKDLPATPRGECYYTALKHFHTKCFNLGRNNWATRQVETTAF